MVGDAQETGNLIRGEDARLALIPLWSHDSLGRVCRNVIFPNAPIKKRTNLGNNSIYCAAFPAAVPKPTLNHGGAYLVALLTFEVGA